MQIFTYFRNRFANAAALSAMPLESMDNAASFPKKSPYFGQKTTKTKCPVIYFFLFPPFFPVARTMLGMYIRRIGGGEKGKIFIDASK